MKVDKRNEMMYFSFSLVLCVTGAVPAVVVVTASVYVVTVPNFPGVVALAVDVILADIVFLDDAVVVNTAVVTAVVPTAVDAVIDHNLLLLSVLMFLLLLFIFLLLLPLFLSLLLSLLLSLQLLIFLLLLLLLQLPMWMLWQWLLAMLISQ